MSENINFEKSLAELEEIVKKLEDANCTLEEAIKLFESGVGITKVCSEYLNTAKLKIETLSNFGEETND